MDRGEETDDEIKNIELELDILSPDLEEEKNSGKYRQNTHKTLIDSKEKTSIGHPKYSSSEHQS